MEIKEKASLRERERERERLRERSMGFLWLRLFCLVWFFFETKQRETQWGGLDWVVRIWKRTRGVELGPNSNIALVTCASCALGNGTNLRAYLEFYWSRMDRLAGWPALNGWYITILVLDWIMGVFNNPTQLVINFFKKSYT